VLIGQHDTPRRLIGWTIWMIVLTGLLLWVTYLVRDILMLIYVAAVFAIGCSPIVRLIERVQVYRGASRISRPIAILVLYLALLAFLGVIAAIGLPPLIAQARELVQNAPAITNNLQDYAIRYHILDHRITMQELLQRAPGPGDAVGTLTNAVSGIVGGVIGFVTILILTFYFLLEADSLVEGLLRFFPRARRPWLGEMCRNITIKVSAWLTGQLLLGAIIGTTAGIGMWVIGVPYALVLALIAAIGELIPVVGPLLAALPAIAVAFSVSPSTALVATIFFFVQQQIENNLLVPKIMEKQVGVSAITVMIALMIGASLQGIVGALLAVPTAAIIQVLVQDLLQYADDLSVTDV
jgi:predicted PurR-regulated permease PerM